MGKAEGDGESFKKTDGGGVPKSNNTLNVFDNEGKSIFEMSCRVLLRHPVEKRKEKSPSRDPTRSGRPPEQPESPGLLCVGSWRWAAAQTSRKGRLLRRCTPLAVTLQRSSVATHVHLL